LPWKLLLVQKLNLDRIRMILALLSLGSITDYLNLD
jgi:hypothetical protein